MQSVTFNYPVQVPVGFQDITRDINKIEKRPSYDEAVSIYRKAKERLLDVASWREDPRLADFDFTLMNCDGETKTGFACEGDFIKFSPNRDALQSNRVKIERILEVKHGDWKSFAMRLQPAEELSMGNNSDILAQSGLSESESDTIIIERSGNKVISYLHQRRKVTRPRNESGGFFTRIFKALSLNKQSNQSVFDAWEILVDVIVE